MGYLQAYHHSHVAFYRMPFGAAPCGQTVVLRLKVISDAGVDGCELRLWVETADTHGTCDTQDHHEHCKTKEPDEMLLPMACVSQEPTEAGVDQVFESRVPLPQTPGLVWYYFRIRQGLTTYYYGNNAQDLGGEGALSEQPPLSYQITVYLPTEVPAWYKAGVMYQIFVDRFAKGNIERAALPAKSKALEHLDWHDPPFYIKDENGAVTHWTFYGGNLQGIIDKLDYLEALGISMLYLNPIFEAASNHKYDTGDYHKIDPMFGDEALFMELVAQAQRRGIAVILDGVFSHTGSDSRYFNKYGHYPELGAYQSAASPFYHWYRFGESRDEYDCWWGVGDLPNVNELEPSYRAFIYGDKDSVVRHWMRRGVSGWRLDVVDEIPDEFLQELRQVVKAENPQAVIIGEVWEDASRKISYDRRRAYLSGLELDGTMNYPLREMLIAYILEEIDAVQLYQRMMSLYENYPRENFRAAMNLIGSHDRIRILTLLGEAPEEDSLTEREKQIYKLPLEKRKLAVARLKLLTLLQMTLPGVPSIYYGDEAGVEGLSDPYNRATYPWGREDLELLHWHQRLVWLRKEYYRPDEGEFCPFILKKNVFGYRWESEREALIVCVNPAREVARVSLDLRNAMHRADEPSTVQDQWKAQEQHQHLQPDDNSIKVPLVLDLLSGDQLQPTTIDQQAKIELELAPLTGKVLYLKKQALWPTVELHRSSGILLHPTSLPSAWGCGDLGAGARAFVDFLADTKQGLWQVLPLNPPGAGCSPYQSVSVFAGSLLMISMEELNQQGLLEKRELEAEQRKLRTYLEELDAAQAEYTKTALSKERLLRKAFARFQADEEYRAFCRENEDWLPDYCLFMALSATRGPEWSTWEKPLASRDPVALLASEEEQREEVAFQSFVQFLFFRQWLALKRYANERGILLIGDLPFYPAQESCDTWTHPQQFALTPEGKPSLVAGVPPDAFSETGQLWGNPVCNWREMERDGYAWWKKRIRQGLRLYDFMRIDHFRGFESYWAVPAGEQTAERGRWLKGPGKKLWESLGKEFGKLPLIAEDLGLITPEVRNLKNLCGFPGMSILQFDTYKAGEEHTIYYSGTHDNDTLLGWYELSERWAEHASLIEEKRLEHNELPTDRERLELSSEETDYLNNVSALPSIEQKRKACKNLIAQMYASQAKWVIIPLQDLLGLGSEARMNTPGTVGGNWQWRMAEGALSEAHKTWIQELVEETKRCSRQ